MPEPIGIAYGVKIRIANDVIPVSPLFRDAVGKPLAAFGLSPASGRDTGQIV